MDAKKVLPTFKDSDRLLKHFMQKQSQSGCARAKAAITAVLQLKAVLHAAPLLAAALTANGHEAPDNPLLAAIVKNLTLPELVEMEKHIGDIVDVRQLVLHPPCLACSLTQRSPDRSSR